jgi:N-acetylglucosamine kinase-like BadF-type ATPase
VAWVASPGAGVVGRGSGGPANHQEVGLEAAAAAVEAAVTEALEAGGVGLAQVEKAVLALAGDDFPEDEQALRQALKPRLGTLWFEIVNDAEAALVAGARSGWGVVVIAGTGTNVMGRDASGRRFHLGGLGYEFGDVGGGQDLVRAVLHAAFRAAEGRGPATALVDAVFEALGVDSLEELARGMYFGSIPREQFQVLAPLVFQVARRGDVVAQDLLVTMGRRLGESAGAACRRIDPGGDAPVEVVLAGSLWHGPHPLLRDGFLEGLHRYSLAADVHLPLWEPVAGSVLLAAEHNPEAASALRRQFNKVEGEA